jgi:hypothetical protein
VTRRRCSEQQIQRALCGMLAPQSEQQIQKAVFSHLSQRGAAGIFAWHPFSGGYRRPKEAAIYKGLGAIAGLPDVMVLHNGRLFCLRAKEGRRAGNTETA